MTADKKLPKKKPIRHLTTAQRTEAISLWKSGTVTIEDLCKRFKKNKSTFMRLFSTEGVRKGEDAEKTQQAVASAVQTAIVNDSTVLANRIRETKEDHYKMAAGIAKLTWNLLVSAKQNNQPIGSLSADMKTLELAAKTLKIVREEKYAVLDIAVGEDNGDKPLPELMIQELTVKDIQEMHRQAMVQSDDDLGGIADIGDMGDGSLPDLAADGEPNEKIEVN